MVQIMEENTDAEIYLNHEETIQTNIPSMKQPTK